MTEPLQQPTRKSVIAKANWHVVMAGVILAGSIPKDADELRLLKDVLRLLKARGPELEARG